MPQKKVLSTITSVTSDIDSINIHTEYNETGELPNTIVAFLGNEIGEIDGTAFSQGDLVIEMKNYLTQINYKINNEGELVVFASTEDLDYYSINTSGELVWNP